MVDSPPSLINRKVGCGRNYSKKHPELQASLNERLQPRQQMHVDVEHFLPAAFTNVYGNFVALAHNAEFFGHISHD